MLIPNDNYFRIYGSKPQPRATVLESIYEAIDTYMKGIGYFLVLSTDFRKNTAEILEIYQMKDVI